MFVDGGYGTGIISAGRTMGRSWRIIWFGGKVLGNSGYLNKCAEMWGGVKAWLKEGGIIDPKDEDLYQDLIGPETVPRLDGKIQLESNGTSERSVSLAFQSTTTTTKNCSHCSMRSSSSCWT